VTSSRTDEVLPELDVPDRDRSLGSARARIRSEQDELSFETLVVDFGVVVEIRRASARIYLTRRQPFFSFGRH